MSKEIMIHMSSIILIEGKQDIELVEIDILRKNRVISFDYDSHKILNELNINHYLIEDYFDEQDKSAVDKFSFELGITWHKQKSIFEFLEYDGIDLGELLDLEIPSYFFQIIKKFIGIKKIIQKENPKEIISYSLKKYVDHLCKNNNVKSNGATKKIDVKLFYDYLDIPINIGIKTINIKISRKNYFKLKKNVEKFLFFLLNVRPNYQVLINNKSILLIDFHTIQYKDLFQEFRNFPYNVIILNQRKPAIWNWNSLQIIKKSKLKVISLEHFENSEMKERIHDEQSRLQDRLAKMWLNDKELEKIFAFDNESFWGIIKSDFIQIINERVVEAVKRILLLKKLFQTFNVVAILDWAHTGMEEKIITHIASEKKIQNYCLQHGVMTLNEEMKRYLPIIPILPTKNTKMLVWGKINAEYALNNFPDSNASIIVGSPRHDRFFVNKNNITRTNTILIASNMFFHYNFNGNDTRTFEYLENAIKKILTILRKYPDKKPIIKLHPAENLDIKSIINKINPNIPVYQHEDILPLLESCDSMISLNYSTILLDSIILRKPTMLIITEKQNFEEEELIKSKSVLCISNISELDNELNKFLFDSNIRNELIKNSQTFLEDYLSNQGSASKNLVKILKNNLS